MEAEKVDAWACPHCHDIHWEREDAACCCNDPSEITAYACDNCRELHRSKAVADKCCVESAP